MVLRDGLRPSGVCDCERETGIEDIVINKGQQKSKQSELVT